MAPLTLLAALAIAAILPGQDSRTAARALESHAETGEAAQITKQPLAPSKWLQPFEEGGITVSQFPLLRRRPGLRCGLPARAS